jgi:hypothetical protein
MEGVGSVCTGKKLETGPRGVPVRPLHFKLTLLGKEFERNEVVPLIAINAYRAGGFAPLILQHDA